MSKNTSELADRAARVREDLTDAALRAGRKAEEVTLVAVSKLHPASAIRELAGWGQVDFGENYVQESMSKQEELADLDVKWHFIGGLQSNKAKFVAGNFELVHSVDSRKLAQALHKKASSLGVVQDILLQVNIAEEAQKSGIAVETFLNWRMRHGNGRGPARRFDDDAAVFQRSRGCAPCFCPVAGTAGSVGKTIG